MHSHNSTFASFPTRKLSAEEKSIAYAAEKKNRVDQDAMTLVPIYDVPEDPNVIGSHVFYCIRADGTIKARIVPLGDHNADQHHLRTDLPCMNLDTNLGTLISIPSSSTC